MDLNQTSAASASLRIQQAEMANLSSYVRLEHASHNPDQLKKVVPRFASAEIPLSRSLMRDKVHLISDAALFHNRQTRVGWSRDLQLLDILHSARVSLVSVKTSDVKLPAKQSSEDLFSAESKNPYIVHLTTYLQHTRRVIVEDVPTLCPVAGSGALSALKASTESLLGRLKSTADAETLELLHYMAKVWKLCIALWAPLDVESGSHAETMARKDTLTHWLEDATNETAITGLQEEEEVHCRSIFSPCSLDSTINSGIVFFLYSLL